MQTVGPGVREMRIHTAGAHRVFYVAMQAEVIYVCTRSRRRRERRDSHDLEIGRDRFRALGKLRQHHGKEKGR